MSVFINNIEIERQQNKFYANITGNLSSGYSLGSISSGLNQNTIEVSIRSKPPAPGMLSAAVMHQFKKTVPIGSFVEGKYAVRINGNNNYVKWFKV